GISPIYFMADKVWWRIMFVVSAVWKDAGWGTIIYLAAIAGVDVEQYEAARIDGARRFKQAWYITLPAIMPTVSLLLIMRMASMMDLGFEHVYTMMNNFVRPVAEVFSTYNFRMGIERMEYSYTTAIGLFQTSINFILLIITNNISRKLGGSTML
ncbi:MAG: ABC transporter permease subunit, partial [Defluviitaleaceae bacterium]|nr:ABC transporter permease subunit [Defluviitaleaceae bacterium]